MGNYLSDSGPNFKAGEVKLNSIPEYQYNKDMKKELKAGHVKKEDLAELYESMLVIREFEEMILKLKNGAYEILSDYEYRGPTHLSIGQEATAAGVCSALNITDEITSTHRGHGDSIAKGFHAIKRMTEAQLKARCPEFSALSGDALLEAVLEDHIFRTIAELFGKEAGYGKGRGGGMHIADFRVGHLGANAIVGGGIPIIRAVREGLAGNEIQQIHGILNGTCNYILTRMENEGRPFDEILADAQKLGYAEADPSLDIDGFDTAHKACILSALAYGFQPSLDQVQVEGIRNLSGKDVQYAADFGYRIKLLAVVAKHDADIEVGVHPTLVPFDHMLASVNGVFNAAMVRGDMVGDTMFYGRGAGRLPTASTVVGDIGDIARNMAHGEVRYARAVPTYGEGVTKLRAPGDIVSRFYLRFNVADKAGAFGTMTTILGRNGVSISAAAQKTANVDEKGFVPVVVLTHPAPAKAVDAALAEIREAGILNESPVKLRML